MASRPTTTVLRVKRPRHVEPVSLLTVDLEANRLKKRLRNDEEILSQGLEQLMHQSSYVSAQQQRHAATVTWKRMSDELDSKNVRYVDARLDDDESLPKTKRRRLALTLLGDSSQKPSEPSRQTTPSPTNKYIILDPLSRLVDESLKQVFSGDTSVAQHLNFVTQDQRLTNNNGSHDWLTWCTRSGGTVLHAAALFNNVDGVERILLLSNESTRKLLLAAVDENGRTPHEVATMAGHDSIAEMLDTQMTTDEDDDFVYDMFCIQHDSENVSNVEETDEMPSSTPMAELRGGIGYWNEQGELILETLPDEDGFDNEEDENDDEDSNCEDYEGNDYPEEQAWLDGDDDSASDEENNYNYRNRPVDLGKIGDINASLNNVNDSSDEEYYQDIDAHYDHYEMKAEPDRLYAYDYELDDDSGNDFS